MISGEDAAHNLTALRELSVKRILAIGSLPRLAAPEEFEYTVVEAT